MIPVLLTKIRTRDKVTLEGIYIKPKNRSDTALVWLHGLTSRFSSGQTLIQELSGRLSKIGIGYFKFNNRGHDVIYQDRGKGFRGGGCEEFTDCVKDIRAMINFARKLGYSKIVLAGSSTGANKSIYYIYKTRDKSVKKLILVAPVSDIPVGQKVWGKKKLGRGLKIARRLGKNIFMPRGFGIQTAGRYLSLYRPGEPEDVVPYHNPRASWKEFKSIRVPILLVIGSRDAYLDRTPEDYIKAFEAQTSSAQNFSGTIIEGGRHGFVEKERELAIVMARWIRKNHN